MSINEEDYNRMKEDLTTLKAVFFGANGSKGFIAGAEEFMATHRKWIEEGRKRSCFYLIEKDETEKKKKKLGARHLIVVKDVGIGIALVTLLLKVFGVI